MIQYYKRFLYLAFALLSTQAYAQHTFTTSNLAPYNQNFNSLSGNVGMSGNTVAGLPEVYAEAEFGGTRFLPGNGAGFTANDGTNAAASYYHFGYASGPDATDRAFGGIGGFLNTTTPVAGVGYAGIRFKNGLTGTTITNLEIQYAMEHWYNSTFNTSAKVTVSYLKGAVGSSLNSLLNSAGTWVNVSALEVPAPSTATSIGGRDGNAASNRRVVNTTVTGINLLPNQEVMIRWAYVLNSATNGNGLSIDDVVVTPQTSVYYSATTGNLDDLTTWNTSPEGTGIIPTSFTDDNQTFYVLSTNALPADADERIGGNLWTVSGANSKIVVGSDATPSSLLVPNDSDIDALIDVSKGSYLLNRHPVGSTPGIRNFRLGSLASPSTVDYFSSSAMHIIAAAQYDNLTISGSNPNRSVNQKVLAGNVIVARTLRIGNGSNLVLDNKNLTLLRNGGVYLVSSETAYVVANGTGSLRVQVPRASSSSKPGDIVTFPVGSSFTSYTPITLQQTSTASDNVFEVRMLDGVYKTYNATTYAPGPTVITAEAVNKTWLISKEVSANPATVTMTLQWNASEATLNFVPAKAHINHYEGGTWDNNSTQVGVTGTGPYVATRTGITSFSPFGVSSRIDGALPVELIAFAAKRTGASVTATWATATEQNSDYFTIERSANGTEFSRVGTVRGAGNSTQRQSYSFQDAAPLASSAYYRLRQTDADGKFSFSPVVRVAGGAEAPAVAVPNPSTGRFEILTSAAGGVLVTQVFNVVGARVTTGISSDSTGRLALDLSNQPAGTYFIRLQTATGTQVVRVVKQ